MRTMRELRDEKGWTPADAASRIGVSVATIYNWETGKTEPKASQFRKLAEVYGVKMEEVILPGDQNRRQDEPERRP